MKMLIVIFSVVTPGSLVGCYQCYGEKYLNFADYSDRNK
jgi:hypothetical protein